MRCSSTCFQSAGYHRRLKSPVENHTPTFAHSLVCFIGVIVQLSMGLFVFEISRLITPIGMSVCPDLFDWFINAELLNIAAGNGSNKLPSSRGER